MHFIILLWLSSDNFIEQSGMLAPKWINCLLGQPTWGQGYTYKNSGYTYKNSEFYQNSGYTYKNSEFYPAGWDFCSFMG